MNAGNPNPTTTCDSDRYWDPDMRLRIQINSNAYIQWLKILNRDAKKGLEKGRTPETVQIFSSLFIHYPLYYLFKLKDHPIEMFIS